MAEQKLPIGTKVFIKEDLGKMKSHFPSGIEAIIEYSYAQQYGGDAFDSYSLLLLNKDGSMSTSAWYDDHELIAVDTDTAKGNALLLKYTEGVKWN